MINFEDRAMYYVDYPLDPDEVDVFKKLEQLEEESRFMQCNHRRILGNDGEEIMTRVAIEKP